MGASQQQDRGYNVHPESTVTIYVSIPMATAHMLRRTRVAPHVVETLQWVQTRFFSNERATSKICAYMFSKGYVISNLHMSRVSQNTHCVRLAQAGA